MDAAVSAVAYWACGYAFAYGRSNNGFIGNSKYFMMDDQDEDFIDYVNWFFQVRLVRLNHMPCSKASHVILVLISPLFMSICSGSLLERWLLLFRGQSPNVVVSVPILFTVPIFPGKYLYGSLELSLC